MSVAIVGVTVALGSLVSFRMVSDQLDEQCEQRALAIGHSVAATPVVVASEDDHVVVFTFDAAFAA